jgi:hypothetical protein
MKTKALLCLQAWKIEELLQAVESEPAAARRLFLIVELVEHVTAHLAVKKNVIYPMIADTCASALVESWQGSSAVRRALVLVARTTFDDALCHLRVRQLRAALAAHAAQDERLVDGLEEDLSPHESDMLGRDAERFHAACMKARRDFVRPPKSAAS